MAVYTVRPTCNYPFVSPIMRRIDPDLCIQHLSLGSASRQVPFSQLENLRQSRSRLHRRSFIVTHASATTSPSNSDTRTFRSDSTQTKSRIFLESEYPPGAEADVVVVGSGLGGLCCAALLAQYGQSVIVCESHTIPGGAAHSFVREGFHFDSGPSFHAGLSMKESLNPLKQVRTRGYHSPPASSGLFLTAHAVHIVQVLDILGEEVPCVAYDTWIGYLPEGVITFKADAEAYRAEIARLGGKVLIPSPPTSIRNLPTHPSQLWLPVRMLSGSS